MDKNKDSKDKGSQLKKYLALTGIAFEMGGIIFVCAYAGKKLDAYYQLEKNWFTMGLVLFGVASSLYLVIKQLDRINNSKK
ncbi:AtpZ/AtpI family protein [uncultured Aquimarina sp.]|uniref:AtpZ/AtpI family protein n=1 Tax=uncultured Aquimarina sp. TaxID=575652 RepID=UPI0026207637|nr:AtpZ/AtpI family protein [uncultured Aquimarina sp.]